MNCLFLILRWKKLCDLFQNGSCTRQTWWRSCNFKTHINPLIVFAGFTRELSFTLEHSLIRRGTIYHQQTANTQNCSILVQATNLCINNLCILITRMYGAQLLLISFFFFLEESFLKARKEFCNEYLLLRTSSALSQSCLTRTRRFRD